MKYIKGLSYFGSKYSSLDMLVPKIQNKMSISTIFVDCFSGGLNVSLNINSIQNICIEADTYISNLFSFLLNYLSDNFLIESIKKLSSKIVDKQSYYFFSLEFNNNSHKFDYYTYYLHLIVLYYHSFNNIIRFNSKGKFNSPYGHRTFTKKHENNLVLIREKFINNSFTFINNDFFSFFMTH